MLGFSSWPPSVCLRYIRTISRIAAPYLSVSGLLNTRSSEASVKSQVRKGPARAARVDSPGGVSMPRLSAILERFWPNRTPCTVADAGRATRVSDGVAAEQMPAHTVTTNTPNFKAF